MSFQTHKTFMFGTQIKIFLMKSESFLTKSNQIWYYLTINTILCLLMLWQINYSASVKVASEPIVFSYLLKAQNKPKWTSEGILFQPHNIDFNTHHFSTLSPPILIYSPVWFVCQTKWWIQCFDWSDRLSIKLPAKGQLKHKDGWIQHLKESHSFCPICKCGLARHCLLLSWGFAECCGLTKTWSWYFKLEVLPW